MLELDVTSLVGTYQSLPQTTAQLNTDYDHDFGTSLSLPPGDLCKVFRRRSSQSEHNIIETQRMSIGYNGKPWSRYTVICQLEHGNKGPMLCAWSVVNHRASQNAALVQALEKATKNLSDSNLNSIDNTIISFGDLENRAPKDA